MPVSRDLMEAPMTSHPPRPDFIRASRADYRGNVELVKAQ